MLLHMSLLLSIFVAERTGRKTGGAVTERESQAMSDCREADASLLPFKEVTLKQQHVWKSIVYRSIGCRFIAFATLSQV